LNEIPKSIKDELILDSVAYENYKNNFLKKPGTPEKKLMGYFL
jgi:hypothetical protein